MRDGRKSRQEAAAGRGEVQLQIVSESHAVPTGTELGLGGRAAKRRGCGRNPCLIFDRVWPCGGEYRCDAPSYSLACAKPLGPGWHALPRGRGARWRKDKGDLAVVLGLGSWH